MNVRVGQPFTDALEVLPFPRGVKVRMLRVEAVGDPALKIAGVMVAPNTGGRGIVQYLPHFPPTRNDLEIEGPDLIPTFGPLRELAGYEFTGRGRRPGPELLVGMVATKPGRYVRTALKITYEVDGNGPYVATDPAFLAACAAAVPSRKECPLPYPKDD